MTTTTNFDRMYRTFRFHLAQSIRSFRRSQRLRGLDRTVRNTIAWRIIRQMHCALKLEEPHR